jgi:hypothetical protein
VEAEAAVEWMVPVDVDPTTLDVELDRLSGSGGWVLYPAQRMLCLLCCVVFVFSPRTVF